MTTGQYAWQATSELVEPFRGNRAASPAARELVPGSLMPLTGTAA